MKTSQELPQISVVIATYNSARTLNLCLESLRKQNYPREKIQLILADGGSTDETVSIGKNYEALLIQVPRDQQSAEYNKGCGLQHAIGDFILCMDHDNILPHPDWLSKMLEPLLKHPDLVASEPLRYRFDPSLSLLDRYFALFGVNDPLAYYLGKADRMDYIHENYNLLGRAEDLGRYYIVQFDEARPRRIPTLGANGFLIRTLLFKKSLHEPGQYFHIDINVDLVNQGFCRYAFIKDDITHLSNSRFGSFLKRRKLFMEQYYLSPLTKRRYSVYLSEDMPKLILFIFYSVTLVKPFVDSLRGWFKLRDRAWFVHPFMCLAIVCIYGLTTLKGLFHQILRPVSGNPKRAL